MTILRRCGACGSLHELGQRCAEQNRKRKEQGKRTGSTRYYRKQRAMALQRDGSCRRCGATTQLEAHHVDGNPQNHALDNLVTLCRTCHDTLEGEGEVARPDRPGHSLPGIREENSGDDDMPVLIA